MNTGVTSFKVCASPLTTRPSGHRSICLCSGLLFIPSWKVVRQSPEDRATTNLIHLNREHNPDLTFQQAICSQLDVENVDSQEVVPVSSSLNKL